jgi:gluconate 2-dehydrogenase gamma chain
MRKNMTKDDTLGRFFDDDPRATLEAAMARIIPSDHDPGAREAGTIEFLDRYLSGVDYIWANPDGSGFVELRGKEREVWAARVETDRAAYLEGVTELDRQSRDRFGRRFRELEDAQQDEILTAIGGAPGPDPLSDPSTEIREEFHWPGERVSGTSSESLEVRTRAFFDMLVLHTREGFHSDPIYGGNRDLSGWKTIGFHGPASLAESHSGGYSSIPYFAEGVMQLERNNSECNRPEA